MRAILKTRIVLLQHKHTLYMQLLCQPYNGVVERSNSNFADNESRDSHE